MGSPSLWLCLEHSAENVGGRLDLAGAIFFVGPRRQIQRQHLIERLLVSNQLRPHQLLASGRQLSPIQAQAPADGAIGVIAQALGIRHSDQKQVKSQPPVVTTADETVADQTMVDPTKTGWNLAEPLRSKDTFDNHKQFGMGWNYPVPEYPAP
jgi:hypothetical protein